MAKDPRALTMSADAATLISALVGERSLPVSAGLRIVLSAKTNSLSMRIAGVPEREDLVISRAGARVFLCTSAAQRVAGRTLCAQIVPERPAFFLDP